MTKIEIIYAKYGALIIIFSFLWVFASFLLNRVQKYKKELIYAHNFLCYAAYVRKSVKK